MGLFPTDDPHYSAVYAEEAALIDASELIAEAMELADVSRADLARALNVSRSEITERLRGTRNMTIRSLAATLHVLGAKLELKAECTKPQSAAIPPVDLRLYREWRTDASHDDTPQPAKPTTYAGMVLR